ncbi:MAG: hypothetical protein Q4A88_08495 [Clostridia bacterium]|nr:hypothetical protein [Clostridia bacterium]
MIERIREKNALEIWRRTVKEALQSSTAEEERIAVMHTLLSCSFIVHLHLNRSLQALVLPYPKQP